MLYEGVEDVVVRDFSGSEEALARGTYRYLVENGVKTAQIKPPRKTEGFDGFLVFAEREEFLKFRQRLGLTDMRIAEWIHPAPVKHDFISRLAFIFIAGMILMMLYAYVRSLR